MKSLLTILSIIFALTAFAGVTTDDLNQLLKEKGTSVQQFERAGARIILGETTGGGRSMQFANVEVVFTRNEAILKREIEAVTLKDGRTVGGLESLRAGGKYITSEDVIAIIVK